MIVDKRLLSIALRQKCPRCGEGNLFRPGLSLAIRDSCAHCGLHLGRHDSGDGPVVFLVFLLGTVLVPLALLLDALVELPLWLHGIIWTIIALGMTIALMRPIKAYVMALLYQHRSSDWGGDRGEDTSGDETE